VGNRKSRLSKQTKSPDRKLLFLVIAFVVIGIVAVADVSAPQALNTYGDKFYFLKLQLEWAGLGLVAFFVASKIRYTFWEKIATPLFLVALILLLVVLLPHFSSVALGARRWITFGPINFQPT